MPATEVNEGTTPATKTAALPGPRLRYAIKTSLSLTLAYLIPMSMGWAQPQTAATTVMLIAATGGLSESLQKGVWRIIGTVTGAVLGLSLISLFPQDRMIYLTAVSCTVAVIIYLYHAYQGDSTVFMLTAVVTLMVFNGGDADGAFVYGVDRAFMTALGVIIYTLVASLLWPVRIADNTRNLAADMATGYRQAFDHLVHARDQEDNQLDAFLAKLLTDASTFKAEFAQAKNHADGVADYLPEWNCVVSDYEELEALLLPALNQVGGQQVEFSRHIANYHSVLEEVERLFHAVDAAWKGKRSATIGQTSEIEFNPKLMRHEKHLVIAAVAARVELLENIQTVLLDLLTTLDSLQFDRGATVANRQPRGESAFNWIDLENFKTAARAFVTFWIATALWIAFNPPGGFMFVTLCTILIPLVSYTPVTPKLLFILFSLGFLFALPAYVFLLPQMTHWLELAAFLFAYAFIGFFVFQGPVSIFFLLGLFTLGIQNTMNYHVDAILLTVVMFYTVCATLIISIYFPFSSRPERLYVSLRRRFFRHCAKWIRLNAVAMPTSRSVSTILQGDGSALLEKMVNWGEKIDHSLLDDNGTHQVAALNRACELLHGQLQVLALRRQDFNENSLVRATQHNRRDGPMAVLCDNLAIHGSAQAFEQMRSSLAGIQEQLDELLGDDYLDRYHPHELAQFYVYLNLQASIYDSIEACRKAQLALDWQRLGETRF